MSKESIERFEKETGFYLGTKAIQFIAITNDGRTPLGKEDYANERIEWLEKKDHENRELKQDVERWKGLVDEAVKIESKNSEDIKGFIKQINTIKEIVDNAPELNMGNYSDDDVGKLNNAMIELYNIT